LAKTTRTSGVLLPHLDTFSRAAEFASFTRAAEALCLTQAAVSQHIRALEHELDVSLFRRHAGRVELTDAGRSLYDYAQQILALHAEARRKLGQLSEEVHGDLRIAASTIPAQHFLTSLLAEFRKLYPQVHVVADVGDSEAVAAMVESSKATLGLVGRKVAVAWAEYRLFATDRLTLVVPSRHRWASQAAVTVEELRAEPLVIREPGSGTRACLERAIAMRRLTLADFNISVELGSNEAIKDAVFRGLGVTVLSIRAVEGELAAGQFHEVTIEGLDLTRELYVVTDHRRALPAPARAFRHFLLTHTPHSSTS
jgi:DNA-binding transcriptional LysR family regulator